MLFITGEDDPDDTLVPRLIESGADLARVAFLTTEAQDRFTLVDLGLMKRAIEDIGDDLQCIAIDPPTAYLGGVDDHKNAELRQLLTPLKNLAKIARTAIIFNTHVTKPQGNRVEAMMRVMGSVAWVNAVRAAHIFARDPEDQSRRFFIPMKNNLGPEAMGLSYRLAFEPGQMASVDWLGEVDITADQAANAHSATKRATTASEWLIEQFRERREWSSEDLVKSAKANGISRNALFEAKSLLDIPKARRVAHPDGSVEWIWWVPPNWKALGASGLGEQEEVAL